MTIKTRFASIEINRSWLFASMPGVGEFIWTYGAERQWSPWVVGQKPGI